MPHIFHLKLTKFIKAPLSFRLRVNNIGLPLQMLPWYDVAQSASTSRGSRSVAFPERQK